MAPYENKHRKAQMVLSHIIIGICNGCSKQQLPMSEYPLTEATIEAIVNEDEWQNTWEIGVRKWSNLKSGTDRDKSS